MMIVADTRPPLHVVLLGVWLGFPNGMAATSRARLLALAIRCGGLNVRVVCARAVDRADDGANREAFGIWHGIPFEYPGGVSLRARSVIRRRANDIWATLCTSLRLARLKQHGQLDCVYLYVAGQHWTPVAAVLNVTLKALRVPVVLELNELPWSMWPARSLIQRTRHPLTGMRGVVAISGYLTSWAHGEASRRHQVLDVVQVPILVDVNELPEPARARTTRIASASRSKPPAVLFAGDVSSQNLDILRLIAAAMAQVWRSHPECRLVCVGSDPADLRLRAILPRAQDGRHLDERVELPGFVPRADLLTLYARASALLLPLPPDLTSIARFPTKLGEYLASRRPVITTDVGEVSLYLTDGVNAFVTPPDDTQAFAAAIQSAIEDPEGAARIGEAGFLVARNEFHYARHSTELASLLSRCAGRATS
jgi:glycosyltransferase involved in cell wall biosynthesis